MKEYIVLNNWNEHPERFGSFSPRIPIYWYNNSIFGVK